jgi:hypothetical protein
VFAVGLEVQAARKSAAQRTALNRIPVMVSFSCVGMRENTGQAKAPLMSQQHGYRRRSNIPVFLADFARKDAKGLTVVCQGSHNSPRFFASSTVRLTLRSRHPAARSATLPLRQAGSQANTGSLRPWPKED